MSELGDCDHQFEPYNGDFRCVNCFQCRVEGDIPWKADKALPLLEHLIESRVLKVEKTGDDRFSVYEACDNWFGVELNKAQMEALIDELRYVISMEKVNE